MKPWILLLILASPGFFLNPALADDGGNRFFSAKNWKMRAGLTAFQVKDSVTFGIGFGVKGTYTTAGGTLLELKTSVIADDDRDKLDSDHIPIWFKSEFKARKQLVAFSPSVSLQTTLDVDHKMNTVSSIEQSASLIPGVRIGWLTKHVELYARIGAGGYYLEIDDDLPEEYSDYGREDLGNGAFAISQEYKALFRLNDALSFSCRYRNYRDTDWELLETWKKIEFTYVLDAGKKFLLDVEKTHYNLDQFSRSEGDNGLAILPFDEDVFYQAFLEFDF